MKKWCLLLFFICSNLFGQVSTNYYGPNAFPVPNMLDGKIEKTNIWLTYTCNESEFGDRTYDFTSGVCYNLDFISFNVWWDVAEFYCMHESWLRHIGKSEKRIKGWSWGDVYVTTDFQVLRENRNYINLTLRSGLKTASGGNSIDHRFYDSPGYFFDSSFGKSFRYFEIVGNLGFLCWQTDVHRQNDAFMYGIMLKRETEDYEIKFSWEGYKGWQQNGDSPNVLKLNLESKNKITNLYIGSNIGLKDWPYTEIYIGLKYNFLWK